MLSSIEDLKNSFVHFYDRLGYYVTSDRKTIAFIYAVSFILVALKVFTYWDLEWYYRELLWGDHMYYWAIGLSFLEGGKFENIIYDPAQPPLNAHIGIGYATYFLISLVGDDPVAYLQAAYLLGSGLIIVSYVAFHFIAREFDLPLFLIPLLFLFFILQTYFFEMHTRGQTETYFYPATLLWFLCVLKVLKQPDDLRWLVGLLIISAVAYSFRIQALIGFIAVLLYCVSQKQLALFVKTTVIFAGAVIIVQLLNLWHTDIIGTGAGESGHMANIRTFNLVRVQEFFSERFGKMFIYESRGGWYIINLFVTLWVVFTQLINSYKRWDKNLLISLLVVGNLLAYLLFRTPESGEHFRYVYHAMPLLLIGYNNSIVTVKNKIYKFVIVIPVLLFVTVFMWQTIHDYSYKEYGKRQHVEMTKSAYSDDQKIMSKYKNKRVFIDKDINDRHPTRYLHAVSKKSFYLLNNKEITHNDLLLLPNYVDTDNNSLTLEKVYEFGRMGEYSLYNVVTNEQ